LLGDQFVMAYDFFGPLASFGMDDQFEEYAFDSGATAGVDDDPFGGATPPYGVVAAVLAMPAKYDALLPLPARSGLGGTA
jgi:hypothetical protein